MDQQSRRFQIPTHAQPWAPSRLVDQKIVMIEPQPGTDTHIPQSNLILHIRGLLPVRMTLAKEKARREAAIKYRLSK